MDLGRQPKIALAFPAKRNPVHSLHGAFFMSQFPPSGQQFPGGYPNQPYGQPGQFGTPGQMPAMGYPPPPAKSGGGSVMAGLFIGCGVGLLVVVIACGVGGYFVYRGMQNFGINIVATIADAGIESIEGISEDEKIRMKAQVERVKQGFKDGKISVEDATQTFESFTKSNAMKAISAGAMVQPLSTHPDLSADEKKAAELTRMRIARGVLDGKIELNRVTQLMRELGGAFAHEVDDFSNQGPDEDMESESDAEEDVDEEEVNSTPIDPGKYDRAARVKQVAADQIRATLKKLDTIADEAGVSKDEAQIKIDYADEVKKIVDAKLGPKGI